MDSFLAFMVVLNPGIEATGVLLFNYNPMWDKREVHPWAHGFRNSTTTASVSRFHDLGGRTNFGGGRNSFKEQFFVSNPPMPKFF